MGKKSFVSIAQTYFDRFPSSNYKLGTSPNKDLKLIVVIPSYNEPHLIEAINSLLNASVPDNIFIEVLVVVNSSKNTDNEIVNVNLNSINELNNIAQKPNINVHSIYCSDLNPKHAGVGWARKIGMDEALRRFKEVNYDGIICCFDADAKVEDTYFSCLWNQFENESFNGASIYFEHPLSGNDFDVLIYQGIVLYETHLRYYKNALAHCGFPFAFHTVGSSMVVKASAYAKQGGMNRRKAGEDFYFINKIISLGNYSEINSTRVIPSPRTSDRVPFGTGRAIKESLEGTKDLSKTYDFRIFKIIKQWVYNIVELNECNYNVFDPKIQSFLKEEEWIKKFEQLKRNTSSKASFNNRFFQVFDAFWTLKCVHHLRDEFYNDSDLLFNANLFFSEFEIKNSENIDQAINTFRKIDKKIGGL